MVLYIAHFPLIYLVPVYLLQSSAPRFSYISHFTIGSIAITSSTTLYDLSFFGKHFHGQFVVATGESMNMEF